MSFSQKGSTGNAGALVDTLTVENASLNQGTISGLSSTDLQTLSELSQEITFATSEMETEEQEIVLESQEIMEHEEEVEAEEMSSEEPENNSEQSNKYSEQLLKEAKANKITLVPPLRPLTIAPKPAKVPIAVKSVGGQQLLLLQGATSGQAIKLVSSQGQELNLTNIISRPVTLKPTFKTISSQGGNISIVQQKPVVMKKILATGQKAITKPLTTFAKQGQHYMVVQKSDQQQLKLLQTQGGNIAMTTATKTLTLQQAQEMGLLANTKLIQQGQPASKQTVLLSKNPQKTIKLVPQVSAAQLLTVGSNTKTLALNTVKAPTKILPANSLATSKVPQKIIFKTTGSNQGILPQGQIIQVAGSQALNTGQLHQINIPGRGMQYIKFVTTNPSETNTLSTTSGNTMIRTSSSPSVGNIVLSEVKTVNKIAPKPMPGKVAISPQRPLSSTPLVVIPSNISTQPPQASKVVIPSNAKSTPTTKTPSVGSDSSSPITPKEEVDADGMRPRKPCNCNKSQCLKLYCDCFANGEFCYMCKCLNCFNNLENEEHRSRAIKACLERNPHAFRPKIGKAKDVSGDQAVRKHTKGCNCKRSGCLKNYCECYEAKIACSNNCKCIGCRNIEDSIDKKNIRHMTTEKSTNTPIMTDGDIISDKEYTQIRPRRSSATRKQTINFITDDVIEATCQCLLTISDNAEENMHDEEMTKRLIIEEFGRCLTEIIDCSSSRNLS
ncbi:hypothetical protein JTB14_032503 [Gonioctena quinquepunctata]|nr:hypothetical protein JTB14_032503 [Gonioctena quinquepunctata]